MTMRCFVSVDLPPQIKDYLGSLARRDIYWIKWMKPENFHITLNFLGELNHERVQQAQEIIQEISGGFSPFVMKLTNLEPHLDMLWLVPEPNPTLDELQGELKSNLKNARLGKKERRSFVPHILLAKSKTGRNMRPVIENFTLQEFLVDKINLYESELTPDAATHQLIQSFPLTPASSPPHEGEKERGP